MTTIDRGDRITVKATFQPKAEDPSFAFAARPTFIAIAKAEGGQA